MDKPQKVKIAKKIYKLQKKVDELLEELAFEDETYADQVIDHIGGNFHREGE